MTLLLNRGEQGGLPSNSRLTVRKRWLLLEVAIHGEIHGNAHGQINEAKVGKEELVMARVDRHPIGCSCVNR